MRNVSLTLILVLGLLVVGTVPAWAQTNEWTRFGVPPEGGRIGGQLIVDPQDPGTLYARNIGDETHAAEGIFKSTNGGANWRLVTLGLPPAVGVIQLAIDPQDRRTLYAAPFGRGLFSSSDSGESWGPTGPTDLWINALAVDPQNRNTLYVFADIRTNNRTVNGAGINKSTDGGKSWVNVRPAVWPATGQVVLAIDPKNSSTLYAAEGIPGEIGMHKSTDGGITWIDSSRQGCYFAAILFSPHDSSTLYTAGSCVDDETSSIFKTTNAGATWSAVSSGLPPDYGINSFAFDPDHPQIMYAGFYNKGPYRSVDGGANWSAFDNGLQNLSVYGFAFSHGTPYATYAVTVGGVVKISSLLATKATLDPASVRLGSPFTATLSGTNLTNETYFDVLFRSPQNDTEEEVLNWQQGLSVTHDVPADSEAGTWTITGVRAHRDIDDHYASYVLVSATMNLNPVVVTAVRFDPSTVLPDGSFTATFSGTNLTSETYFDLRFRRPGSDTDQFSLNWQKGPSTGHSVPIDTAVGAWTVTGIWAHENAGDHSSDFVPVSTVLVMTRR